MSSNPECPITYQAPYAVTKSDADMTTSLSTDFYKENRCAGGSAWECQNNYVQQDSSGWYLELANSYDIAEYSFKLGGFSDYHDGTNSKIVST